MTPQTLNFTITTYSEVTCCFQAVVYGRRCVQEYNSNLINHKYAIDVIKE